MINLDELKVFLPRFLSDNSEKALFEGLKGFPDNIDKRFYTNKLRNENIIFQGDGIRDLLVINLPEPKIANAPAIILSNTCDIDVSNTRMFPTQIIYAPIFNLEKYRNSLIKNLFYNLEKVDAHISSIKKQEITQIFFLPSVHEKLEESLVFLDRINNCSNKIVSLANIENQRIFTLSDYGEYLFLLKLSIHFTRMKDKVDRGSEY